MLNILRESKDPMTIFFTLKGISSLCQLDLIRRQFMKETGITYVVKAYYFMV